MNNTIRYCQLIVMINKQSLSLEDAGMRNPVSDRVFKDIYGTDIDKLNSLCAELDALTAERNQITGI